MKILIFLIVMGAPIGWANAETAKDCKNGFVYRKTGKFAGCVPVSSGIAVKKNPKTGGLNCNGGNCGEWTPEGGVPIPTSTPSENPGTPTAHTYSQVTSFATTTPTGGGSPTPSGSPTQWTSTSTLATTTSSTACGGVIGAPGCGNLDSYYYSMQSCTNGVATYNGWSFGGGSSTFTCTLQGNGSRVWNCSGSMCFTGNLSAPSNYKVRKAEASSAWVKDASMSQITSLGTLTSITPAASTPANPYVAATTNCYQGTQSFALTVTGWCYNFTLQGVTMSTGYPGQNMTGSCQGPTYSSSFRIDTPCQMDYVN